MAALPFFDANCMIGTRATRHARTPWRLEEYRADFQQCDIMGAVVYHAVARDYSADYGNRRLMAEIGDDVQLSPQWVLLPHQTGEMPPAPELVAEMLAAGVRSARILPTAHRYPPEEHIIGYLLNELERHRIPLFVDTSEVSYDDVIGMCGAHPLLPVVLCGATYADGWQIETACRQCENLHIETHLLQGHHAYSRFVDEFGADRLIFGTDMPHRSPGAARMMTCYEDIPEDARRKIAGENMLRLLRNVRGASGRPLPNLPSPPDHPDDDPITAAVRAGEPLSDEFVLDSHGHFAHPGAMGAVGYPMPAQDADGAVKTMDRIGIDILVFSTWSGLVQGDLEANDVALDAVAKYPDRLMAYGCYNPNYPDMYKSELDRVFRTGKVVGIKPYGQYSRVRLDDPVRDAAYQWANDNEKPVLGCGAFNEAQQMSPAIAQKLAERFPNARFIISHASKSYDFAEATIEACKAFSNIFAEVCYSQILYGTCEMLCENIPIEQVLYGSDALMRDPAPQLGWVAWADISYEDKQKVLGHNFADVLKLPPQDRYSRT